MLKAKFKGRTSYEIGSMSDIEKKTLCYDLLSEFGAQNITEKGDEISHSCCLPFGLHANGDKHPSANLNWRKMVYSCFGCGSSGGLFWFVASCRGESGAQVRDWAMERTAGDTDDSLRYLLDYLDVLYNPQADGQDAPIPKYNPAVLKPWMKIHPYMTDIRGIPEENLIFKEVGFDEKTNRIVFPHRWKGELVGWQTRRLIKDGTPKYVNSSDFPKDKTLYNLIDLTDRKQTIVVVESPMSVVAKLHAMPHNWWPVATFGAKVTDRQKDLISDHERVILWFDNDQAGWTATQDVAEGLAGYTDVILVVNNPYTEDMGGLPDDVVKDLIGSAVSYNIWNPPQSLKVYS